MTKHTYTDEDGEGEAATLAENLIMLGAGALLCAILGFLGWIIWG